MNLPLTLDIAEEAYDDLAAIGFYFAKKAPTVEERFYLAFDETVRRLAQSPVLGERCRFRNPATKGMRMWLWLVSGFSNYLVFYRPKDDVLQVLRVIHGARNYAAIFEKSNV